jgi:thiamine-phosphate pyrophosphorylase
VNRSLPPLHAVTNSTILGLMDFQRRATEIARSPQVALHIRTDSLGARSLTELTLAAKTICNTRGAQTFVNDRVDVALASAAHGIHLPGGGIPTTYVRRLVGADAWIGRSTHSVDEALAAQDEGVDYVFLGPIWPTTSHPERPALGTGAISGARTTRVIAIGGVTPERVRPAIDAGAYGVAAISAFWFAPDCGATVERMLLSFDS